MTIFIGNNDVLGAATSGTAVEGLTLTPMASVNADLDTIFGTLKAAQGGTGKGVVMLIPDVATIPFFTTVSATLGVDPSTTPPTTDLRVSRRQAVRRAIPPARSRPDRS